MLFVTAFAAIVDANRSIEDCMLVMRWNGPKTLSAR